MCARLGNRAFLVQRNDSIYLAPEWVAAPKWVDSVIGREDHSDTFTMLYADSRGVCRTYRRSLDADRWTMSTQPGPDFYQRFEGVFNDDRTMIDARWEASTDGQHWTTDFNVTYRRLSDDRCRSHGSSVDHACRPLRHPQPWGRQTVCCPASTLWRDLIFVRVVSWPDNAHSTRA